MQDAATSVPAFASQIEFVPAIFFFREAHAEINQFPDERRSLAHDRSHHVFFAQSRPGRQRVLNVEIK
jgi:hypothetical protein